MAKGGFLKGLFGGNKKSAKGRKGKSAVLVDTGPTARETELATTHQVEPKVVQAMVIAVREARTPKNQRADKLVEQLGVYRQFGIAMADAAVPNDEVKALLDDARAAYQSGEFESLEKHMIAAADLTVKGIKTEISGQGNGPLQMAAGHYRALCAGMQRMLLNPVAAAAHYQAALEFAPENAGKVRAGYLHRRALCDIQANKFSEAEAALKAALNIIKKLHGPKHEAVGKALCDLGQLYMNMGRASAAEKSYRDALSIYEKCFGENSVEVAVPISLLAEMHTERGVLYRAEPYLHRQIEILIGHYGRGSTEAVKPLRNLAKLYRQNKRASDAQPLLLRALDALDRAYPRGHEDIATTRMELGQTLEVMRQYQQAETAYTRALAIRDKLFGDNNPASAECLLRLASVYLAENKNADAKRFLSRCLEILDDTVPAGSAISGEAMAMMAEVCRKNRAYADAAPLFRRAIITLQRYVGPTHPLVAQTLEHFAQLHMDQDRELEAENMFAEAAGIREQIESAA
jgi:tetratricopeptide (TPR) repeat protein